MKRHIFLVASVIALSAAMTSCEDTLTEKPDSSYEKDTYFEDNSKAEMAVLGIYSSISDANHYGSCEMATPASDDQYYINGTSSDNTRRDIAHYTVTSNNTWLRNIWQLNYQGIDRANLAIDGMEHMSGYGSDKTLTQLVAETRFLRAFQAFDLVKYWGDVPFKTTYSKDYSSAFSGRVDREQIYDQIIADLNFAKENLPWATASSSPERATQGAARALLMRVLLQRAGYSLRMNGKLERPDDSKRKEYFEQVIREWEAFAQSNHGFYDGGYEALFKSFSQLTLNPKESIFEIAFYHDSKKRTGGWWGTYNGPEVAQATLDSPLDADKYMGRANAFFRVVPEWYDYYDANDVRRDVNIVRYTYVWNKNIKQQVKQYNYVREDGTGKLNQTKWYPGKWRREWMGLGYKDPNSTDVNYCVLRYADVVLMAAEAYNETGNTGEAWRLINLVRERAGVNPINSATDYEAAYKKTEPRKMALPYNEWTVKDMDDATEQGKVRTALFWERGFELCFEGQRKYDLVRWGILKDALTWAGENATKLNPADKPTKAYPAYINFQTGKHELFPIPLNEMQSNPLLEGKNNPGYN